MNKNIFKTVSSKKLVKNEAGGNAYLMTGEHQLAQLAVTGTFSNTFYTKTEFQLEQVLELAFKVNEEFLAKTAIYSRKFGFMKDMPAVLAAVLVNRDPILFEKIFPLVIDNGKMIKNLVQVLRSGQINGRKSIPLAARRQIRKWLKTTSYRKLLNDSVGETPSLKDVIAMIHPKPKDDIQEAFFGWLCGREKINKEILPDIVKEFENFKKAKFSGVPIEIVPNVEFRLLTALPLSSSDWMEIAKNGGYHMCRINLNTFSRHGVFKDKTTVELIAKKLSNRELILSNRVMPYQILSTLLYAESQALPWEIKNALQDALDISLENVPEFSGNVYVFVDISGSMRSAVAEKSIMTSLQVATLFAASVLRKNPRAQIIPFHEKIQQVNLNHRDSVLTNSQILANLPSGGTNISLPLNFLNQKNETDVNLCIFISDNESWIDDHHFRPTKTAAELEWQKLKNRNTNAKLVCIDIVPNSTSQFYNRSDILNIGGFTDTVFSIIELFAKEKTNWVETIKSIEI